MIQKHYIFEVILHSAGPVVRANLNQLELALVKSRHVVTPAIHNDLLADIHNNVLAAHLTGSKRQENAENTTIS